MNMEKTALIFATKAHGEQKRKYTNEPYINHPKAVAALVKTVWHDKHMIAAALLHDTIEDTETTYEAIKQKFGRKVAQYVLGLSDVSKPSDGNRKIRKQIDRDHLSVQCKEVKTIKLADLIDNSHSIIKYDTDFAIIYMNEMELLLHDLKQGDYDLLVMAKKIVKQYKKSLSVGA